MSSSTRRLSPMPPVTLGLALLPLALFPAHVTAQDGALLRGLVADELTGEVISSARVTIVGEGLKTRTSDAGTFAFPNAPIGALSIRVEADGYPAVVDEVEVTPGEVLFMHVVLPQVQFILGGILVSGSPTRQPRETSRLARTAADLLAQQIPGVQEGGVARTSGGPVRLRGVNSIVLSSEPVVLLDGFRLRGSMSEIIDALRRIPAEHVRRIRILRGPSAAFAQGAASGAIVVETTSSPDENR